ncbi:OmpA family protein [Kamptonema animale CS-326]|jgi:outer membrane protein OmpA-like peptidoglycan-associated protein|uniref:OmpA family protein n=1 Tax=Kamptonema animale TaxID=92934 RepID=UPI00232DB8AF|nr:OmpA family protein [Kamptonema animale]MDB9511309.1 OmpA family protein [Kamptonema animale CS-326]
MALSEENLADLNQQAGFVSEAKKARAQPATQLQPLVHLLTDLKILEQAEKSKLQPGQPAKDSAQVVFDNIICSEASPPTAETSIAPNNSNFDNLRSGVIKEESDPLENLLLQLEKLTEPIVLQQHIPREKAAVSDVVDVEKNLSFWPISKESSSSAAPELEADFDKDLHSQELSNIEPSKNFGEDSVTSNHNVVFIDDSVTKEQSKEELIVPSEAANVSQREDFVRPVTITKAMAKQSEYLDGEYLDVLVTAVTGLENLLEDRPEIPEKLISQELTSQELITSPPSKNLDVLISSPEDLPRLLEEKQSLELEAETAPKAVENSEESLEAIEQLQNLIFGSKISELDDVKTLLAESDLPGVRHLMKMIEHKLGNLEHQIYDPQELIALLLPWIGDILSLKISESREEIIKVMVPIIDEVIKAKTQQDKQAMSAAIADLLPEAISQQIKNSPQEMANAIAPEIAIAIREQIRLDQESIAEALAPEMGKAIKAQIELERDAMVDALYPVIGNTIAKYLGEAIKTINEKVANAFSIEGVQRKIKAQMQGVSEAELILKEAVPFSVQAVFLIHKASGLVIAEVQPANKQRLESDMVAGMLTAIRSFVNDCIAQSGEVSELNEIEYGDSKIILEVAGYCYLAVVIKGEQPQDFVNKMRETLSTIIMKYGKPIEFYDGDPDKIPEQVHTLIERIFKQVSKEKESKPPTALLAISLVVSSLFLVPWGMYEYRQRIERRVEANTATALSSAPDLAVYRLKVDVEKNTLKLTGNLPNQGLRAKAEKIAQATAPNLKVDNKIIAIDVPPDPASVAAEVKRVTAVLNQIEGVSISSRYGERKVTVEGTVMQMTDAQKIAQSMKQVPGVQSVISTVKLNPLKITTRIYFNVGSASLNSEYGEVIGNIKEFLKQYPQKHLKIIGHSDRKGNLAINQQLARKRAEAVRVALVQQGVDPRRLQVVASLNPPADVESSQPLLLSRCAIFEPITQRVKTK